MPGLCSGFLSLFSTLNRAHLRNPQKSRARPSPTWAPCQPRLPSLGLCNWAIEVRALLFTACFSVCLISSLKTQSNLARSFFSTAPLALPSPVFPPFSTHVFVSFPPQTLTRPTAQAPACKCQ